MANKTAEEAVMAEMSPEVSVWRVEMSSSESAKSDAVSTAAGAERRAVACCKTEESAEKTEDDARVRNDGRG